MDYFTDQITGKLALVDLTAAARREKRLPSMAYEQSRGARSVSQRLAVGAGWDSRVTSRQIDTG